VLFTRPVSSCPSNAEYPCLDSDLAARTTKLPCGSNADEVAAKALDLMAPILGAGRANELIAAVYGLDKFGPVSGLRRLLQA
jgi:hypothetical protein